MLDRAIQGYDQTIQLDPKNANAYANRGRANFYQESWEALTGGITIGRQQARRALRGAILRWRMASAARQPRRGCNRSPGRRRYLFEGV
jgi:hypothetical protein